MNEVIFLTGFSIVALTIRVALDYLSISRLKEDVRSLDRRITAHEFQFREDLLHVAERLPDKQQVKPQVYEVMYSCAPNIPTVGSKIFRGGGGGGARSANAATTITRGNQ